jgi:hypothetical protein
MIQADSGALMRESDTCPEPLRCIVEVLCLALLG